MKQKILSVLLAAVMFVTCTACTIQPEGPLGPEELRKSRQLSLLVVRETADSGEFKGAVRLFNQLYPDVDVTVETLDWDDYGEQIEASLMAGKGPDIILGTVSQFLDIYKMMDNGVFLDLSQLIEKDKQFHREEYLDVVLKAGMYQGAQYLIPISYDPYLLATTEETLSQWELDALEQQKDYRKFWESIVQAARLHGENLTDAGIAATLNGQMLLEQSGISLVDRETGSVLPDPEQVQTFSEVFRMLVMEKKLVPETWNDSFYSGKDLYEGMASGQIVMARTVLTKMAWLLTEYYAYMQALGTPVLFPMPDIQGQHCGVVREFIAINAAAENQENAWNFLKAYFEPEAWSGYLPPVCAKKTLQRGMLDERLGHLGNSVYLNLGIALELNEADIDYCLESVCAVEQCRLEEPTLWRIYWEQMQPYFYGEKSYESCIKDLEEQLTIYVTE